MGEKSDQLERHIREERNELSQHISELHQKVKSAVDWRVQFNERPLGYDWTCFRWRDITFGTSWQAALKIQEARFE